VNSSDERDYAEEAANRRLRAAFTAALREMADYLDAHPDLPLPSAAEVAPYLDGTDEQDRAEVDRIAGILGARPETTPGGHYRVSRTFGARVTYQAVAIPDQQMQDWEALMSYRSAVTPVTAAEPVVPAAGGSTCPGHVGRGIGVTCVVCGLPIPAGLRRTVDSPSELRPGCADCAAGRAHVHPGGVS
jgi:hypothetical protein